MLDGLFFQKGVWSTKLFDETVFFAMLGFLC